MIQTSPIKWNEPSGARRVGFSRTRPTRPVHCALLAIDITAFGGRDTGTQQLLHVELYRIAEAACEAAGMPWSTCHREDRGDGILLIAPPDCSAELLDPVAAHLRAELRRHNGHAGETAKMRLRVAIHAGYVRHDGDGVCGGDLVHLFRLLEAPQFKTRMATAQADFALIASGYLYEEVIRHGPGLIEPAAYEHITIAKKETRTDAWTWLSGDRTG